MYLRLRTLHASVSAQSSNEFAVSEAMTRPTRQSAPGDKIRTILASCLFGVRYDTVWRDAWDLPFLIFSAAYLIIPYPRPIVVLYHTLPAVATKFLLLHAVHYTRLDQTCLIVATPTRFEPQPEA
jgi:hypothetical protein